MDNKELQRQIEALTQRVETMEKAQNLDQNVLLFDSLFSDKGGYDTDLKRTISGSIPSGGGSYSFVVPEDPVGSLKINYKGTKYRILLYSLS